MSDPLSARLAGLDAGVQDAAAAARRFVLRAEREGLIDVAYARTDSPLGVLLLAATPRGLVRLAYDDAGAGERALEALAARVSPRVLERPALLDPVRRQLEEYFAGRRVTFEVATDPALIGPFAGRVLARTAAIPYGDHSSYRQIATEIGSPRAARAVGNALGGNPLPIVIPCHRVLPTGGGVGGYAGGSARKAQLLELEGRAH